MGDDYESVNMDTHADDTDTTPISSIPSLTLNTWVTLFLEQVGHRPLFTTH